MNKRLRDWTLLEIREFCESLGPYTHSCEYCPFYKKIDLCIGKIIIRDYENKKEW